MREERTVRLWPRPGLVFTADHAPGKRLRRCLPFLRGTECGTIIEEFLAFGAFIEMKIAARRRKRRHRHAAMLGTYAMTAWEIEAEMLVAGTLEVLDDESPVGLFFGDDGQGNFGWWVADGIAAPRRDAGHRP